MDFPTAYASRHYGGDPKTVNRFIRQFLETCDQHQVQAEFEKDYGLPVVVPAYKYPDPAATQDLKCVVCLDVAENAKEAVCCSVLICEECEIAAPGDAAGGQKYLCPCREDGQGFRPNRPLRRIVDNLNVHCEGCGEKMKKDRFAAHASGCPSVSRKIKCPATDFESDDLPWARGVRPVLDTCEWTGSVHELAGHLEHGCALGLAKSTEKARKALGTFDKGWNWSSCGDEMPFVVRRSPG